MCIVFLVYFTLYFVWNIHFEIDTLDINRIKALAKSIKKRGKSYVYKL